MSSPSAAQPRYRDALPQLGRVPFLADGGIETTLIFHDGHDLPHFAAYDLLTRDGGEDAHNYIGTDIPRSGCCARKRVTHACARVPRHHGRR